MINTTRLPITTHFSASHKITKAQQKASADATAIDRACHAALEIMINHLFSRPSVKRSNNFYTKYSNNIF